MAARGIVLGTVLGLLLWAVLGGLAYCLWEVL
jgi:hypothetical protein